MARAFTDPTDQAEALVDLATARSGETRAAWLLAEALQVPWPEITGGGGDQPWTRKEFRRWEQDLQLLCRIAPDVVPVWIDEFQRLYPSPQPPAQA